MLDDIYWGIVIAVPLALTLWVVGGAFGVFPW